MGARSSAGYYETENDDGMAARVETTDAGGVFGGGDGGNVHRRGAIIQNTASEPDQSRRANGKVEESVRCGVGREW